MADVWVTINADGRVDGLRTPHKAAWAAVSWKAKRRMELYRLY